MAGGPRIKNNTQSKYYPFDGGLDVVTPALSVDPGFALAMVNYEPFFNGGYRRIDGYERLDGRLKPSAAAFLGVPLSNGTGILFVVNSTGTFTGLPGTGLTSGATCQVVSAVGVLGSSTAIIGGTSTVQVLGTTWLALTRVVGTFTNGEQILVGTTTSTGTFMTTPSINYAPSGTGSDFYMYSSEFLASAQHYYRLQIQPVPGTGNIQGAWQNGTNIYAIRAIGTASALMYRSTANGWSAAGINYATCLYYSGLLNSVQSAQFNGSVDTSGILNVTSMVSGTIYTNGTIGDVTGLVPIGAVIVSALGTATGQAGQYQLSVNPSIAVGTQAMFTLNPPAQLPTAGQLVVGATSSATATLAYAVSHDTTVGYVALTGPIYKGGTATFVNGEVLRTVVGGVGTNWGTAASNGTAFSLPPNGFYRFKNSNFYANSSTYNTYGVSGVGPAFQIDQAQLVVPVLMPLTQMPGQPGNGVWPFLLECHTQFLFLAFPGGIYQQSVNGSPLQFNGFLGAAEFSTGDELTGMISTLGPNLVLPTVHATYALAGNSDANFVQTLIAEKAGMILFSGQLLDTVYALNNLGITSLSRTQSYGNFVGSTVSQLVQPIVSSLRAHFTDSTIVRASNQARFYFDDGTFLIMYIPGLGDQNKANAAAQSGVTAQFGYAQYPAAVHCIYNSEDQNDLEVGYFGFANADGYVYQDRSGTSFDGAAVSSYVRLAFNNVGSPALRKYFRRVDLELNATTQVALKFAADFSYSSEAASSAVLDLTATDIPALNVFGGGGYWNSVYWNNFVWDGQTISSARAVINGTGQNVSFLIFHQAITDAPFVLQGATIYFDPRRLQR